MTWFRSFISTKKANKAPERRLVCWHWFLTNIAVEGCNLLVLRQPFLLAVWSSLNSLNNRQSKHAFSHSHKWPIHHPWLSVSRLAPLPFEVVGGVGKGGLPGCKVPAVWFAIYSRSCFRKLRYELNGRFALQVYLCLPENNQPRREHSLLSSHNITASETKGSVVRSRASDPHPRQYVA